MNIKCIVCYFDLEFEERYYSINGDYLCEMCRSSIKQIDQSEEAIQKKRENARRRLAASVAFKLTHGGKRRYESWLA